MGRSLPAIRPNLEPRISQANPIRTNSGQAGLAQSAFIDSTPRTPTIARRSISAILTRMNLLVICIALVLVYLSFLAYNLLSFRQATVGSLTAEAQIVGSNCVSAILFNDRPAAEKTLSALARSPEVVSAAVYTQGGQAFAQYLADGAQPLEPRPIPPGRAFSQWFSGLNVLIASPIVFNGHSLGTIYIQARLRDLGRQFLRYTAIAGGILLFSFCVALMAGSILRTLLAQPIVALASTARSVSRSRDYSLRFDSAQNYNELASLTVAFNEMLAEIQQRDAALEQSRSHLELRVAERTAQLEAANRELESFSYTVAHDLRGPLQAIVNVCFLLGEKSVVESLTSSSPLLSQLRTSVSDMSGMIDDLLNLSRSTTSPLELVELNLSQVAAAILQSLAESDSSRHVETVVEAGCIVSADPGLMTITLQNLLRNAWKFTGRRATARIEFGCALRGSDQVFFVRDNGAGFDPRMADRLFKPFHRLHNSSDFPGTGIGLATVQRIVRRHGGRIWAEGEPEKGATFYFTLPQLTPPEPSSDRAIPPAFYQTR